MINYFNNGMIRNEKYTGDVLYQKSYTDDQFNRHRNLGDAAQYYVRDHLKPKKPFLFG